MATQRLKIDTVDVDSINAIASGVNVNHINKVNSLLVKNDNCKEGAKVHISEQKMTLANWPQHVNWLNATIVVLIPVFGIVCAFFTPLQKKTAIWAFFYYCCSGIGITAGYHRLWSHRCYKAVLPVRIVLAAIGGAAIQGSIKWWSNGHRTHHRFTDTDKDPYNAKKGFMYSHIGWMIFKQNPKLKGRTDISDINADPIVRFQHKHFLEVLLFMGFIFPCMVAGLGWGDWWGGFIWAGIIRLTVVHQATFCVNSLAHWIGDQPFDDIRTPRDHVLTAFVTFGEGYHNFHHEFPSDYRNAIKWYQYDPTKWLIRVLYTFGLAYDLQTFSQNAIEQGLVQQEQKKLDRWRSSLNWGVPIEQLPIIDYDDFKAQSKDRALVLVAGIIHDVTDFLETHPGGLALIKSAIGKDATAVFNGGVYKHSNAGHNLLSTYRVAVLRGGCEVEIWKNKGENKSVKDSEGAHIIRSAEQLTRVAGAAVASPVAA
ncbi:hypothetical protein NADFUDRAFT_48902 [Nadsonia fulvescens var. elongata DSM 6958]|uniref:Acyl-CoA desaturase n=1 Tax=Nadsonia fulvescens var. elongata DSM 6958 TaxID=857566 RepID=A0A1E3PTJ0_9ASCO|nr:hypothetical protein NADFUDRAFT_48902 [Nadsonia fulvescens var. elongata DSM 6958]